MYSKLSRLICERLIKYDIIPASKKAVYLYGFEVFISSAIYFIVFWVVSIISQCIFPSLLFWLGLFIIRKVAGGHHAKNYLSCHILFEINHILFIVLYHVIPGSIYIHTVTSILIFSSLSIFLFAPIDHVNKPFVKNEYRRFRTLSLLYSAILMVLTLLCFVTVLPANHYMFSYAIGTLSATLSLLCGKAKKLKERKKS